MSVTVGSSRGCEHLSEDEAEMILFRPLSHEFLNAATDSLCPERIMLRNVFTD